MNNIFVIPIDIISYGKAFLYPRYNIQLEASFDGKKYCASFPEFNIEIYANSLKEVEDEFCEYISELWESYVCADDSELTSDAIELKHSLQNAFSFYEKKDFVAFSPSTLPDSRYISLDWNVNYGRA